MLSKSQLIVILGAFLVIVLLFIAPRTKRLGISESSAQQTTHEHSGNSNLLETYCDSIIKNLSLAFKPSFERYMAIEGISRFDSLIEFWKSQKQPVLAARSQADKAEKTQLAKDWAFCGKLFYIGSGFSSLMMKNTLMGKAIDAFTLASEKEPANLEYKTSLGVCYVEGGSDPMKGIGIMREVLTADSNYVEAHFRLGLFAIQSQQLDKAISRFNKVIKLNPNFIEAYLYLGEIYAEQGNKNEAITILEKAKSISNDALVIEQIEKYIENLKTKL